MQLEGPVRASSVFEDEADTISVDEVGFDAPVVDALESTRPIELKTLEKESDRITAERFEERPSDTFRDVADSPFASIELEDTDMLIVSAPALDDSEITDRRDPAELGRHARPATNADWPPAPKRPAARQNRRAGMYKAISSITKLNAMRRTPSS